MWLDEQINYHKYKCMLYLKHNLNITEIYTKAGFYESERPVLSVIRTLCEKELFSYDERIKITRKQLSINIKVPIYINENTLLMPTKSPKKYDNIWINYYEVFEYNSLGDKTVVLFSNLTELILDIKIKNFKTMMKKADLIDTYIYNRKKEIYINPF